MIYKFEVKENSGERRAWINDPYAGRVLKKVRDEMKVRLKSLVNVCQNSTDPDVLRALNKFEQVAAIEQFLKPKSQADDDE